MSEISAMFGWLWLLYLVCVFWQSAYSNQNIFFFGPRTNEKFSKSSVLIFRSTVTLIRVKSGYQKTNQLNWPWSLECYNTLKTGVQTHILDNNQLQLFYCCFCRVAHTFSFCRIISSVWAHYDHVTTQCPGLQSMSANHLFPGFWLVDLSPFWSLIGWLKSFFLRMRFVWQQSNQCHCKILDDHFWTNLLNFEKLNAWNFKGAQS